MNARVLFWSARNLEHVIQRAAETSGLPRATEAAARSVMLKTEWLYGTPNHQGTAALLEPDTYLPASDPGRMERALNRLNTHAIRELVQNLGEERRAEAAYTRELTVPLGDRLLPYPAWNGRAAAADTAESVSGSARLLPGQPTNTCEPCAEWPWPRAGGRFDTPAYPWG